MSAERHDEICDAVVAARRAAQAAANDAEDARAASGYADFADPPAAAESVVRGQYTLQGTSTLQFYQGEFHLWDGTHYIAVPVADLRAKLYEIGRQSSAKPVKKRVVDDVLDALRATVNLSFRDAPEVPVWLQRADGDPPADSLIPLRNGLLRLKDSVLIPPTPRFFAPYCLPFDYDSDPPAPAAWHRFLESVWPGDHESIDTLQEAIGYLLTSDTKQQKIFGIFGPPRSGKGVIGRTLVQLVGRSNCVSPALGSLGQPFGLQPLIGKTVCLVSDARAGAQTDTGAVLENALRIAGEDLISVPRKFQVDYTGRLLARIVMLGNEVPLFRDAAGALASRFIILRTQHSFLGREDHGLEAKLAGELPGIFVWAIEGLQRLRERGHFVQPRSALDEVRLMQELASPIRAFLRDICVMEPGSQVPVQKLFAAWRDWCHTHGRDKPGTEQTFGRDMQAAVPGLRSSRPRIEGARVRMYSGVRLRDPNDVEVDDDDVE